mmetsp:Transcript_7150/g.21309  ORF Transcript_7150/g.21309 Transcript_7150/m.21309 type:complete len:126 (+) Transcript_7150:531-908(+)
MRLRLILNTAAFIQTNDGCTTTLRYFFRANLTSSTSNCSCTFSTVSMQPRHFLNTCCAPMGAAQSDLLTLLCEVVLLRASPFKSALSLRAGGLPYEGHTEGRSALMSRNLCWIRVAQCASRALKL